MNARISITCLALAGMLGVRMPAAAGQNVPLYQDTVVVTASAAERDEAAQTATVTVIDRQELDDRQVHQLSEALATVPGAAVVTSGVPGQTTSLFLRGAESDQTLLLWNGVALNSPYFGAVNWQFVPTDGAERIEVVLGAASSLYGGNALGGVVQLLSGALEGGKAELEGGADDYVRGAVSYGHTLGSARIDLDASSRRGESEFANGFFDSDDVAARWRWQPAAAWSVSLVTRWNEAETGIPFTGAAVPTPGRTIGWEERTLALPVSWSAGAWSVEAQLSHIDSDYAFRDPQSAFGFTRSDTEASADRVRAVASWRGRPGLRVAFGTEAERLEATDSSNFGLNLDGARQETWAVFGEAAADLGPVRLSAGVRRDDNDAYGAETSFRAGALLRATEAWSLRASYGEAFRAPTLGELFFPFSGSAALQPERGESWELGTAWQRGALELGLTLFQLDQKDLIDFDLTTFTFANIARVRSRGAELAARWRGERLDARLGTTWLDTENLDTGLELLRRPERSASLSLAWKQGPVRLSSTLRYVGERPDADPTTFARTTNPSYTRLDLGVRWQALPRLAPYARVENAADREYQEALGFPAAGRTWAVGLGLGF
jgi:vitamin B12 transporter